jgi:hypothetical protein
MVNKLNKYAETGSEKRGGSVVIKPSIAKFLAACLVNVLVNI